MKIPSKQQLELGYLSLPRQEYSKCHRPEECRGKVCFGNMKTFRKA